MNSVADLLLFTQIALFAAALPVLMRLPLPKLLTLLQPDGSSVAKWEVHKVVKFTQSAVWLFRPLVQQSCITYTLTRYYFLSRAGLEVTVHFGVGKPENNFVGHCWLSCNDMVFLEKVDPKTAFTETYRFPARGNASPV